jgi:hypothetical protein
LTAVSKRCPVFTWTPPVRVSTPASSDAHIWEKVRHTSTTVAEEPFEMAADAVIEGRLTRLQALLRDQPGGICSRADCP